MLRPFALSAVLAALCGTSAAEADPVWTSAPSVMRRAPGPTARFVQEVPATAQIDLRGCSGDWCKASWRNRSGYVPAYAVNAAPPPVAAGPPVYGAPPSVFVTPPLVVGGPPPAPVIWGGPYVGFGAGAW